MDSLVSTINAAIELPINFEGQKKVRTYNDVFLYVSIVVSVLTGVLTQNILGLVAAFALCFVVAALVTFPPWPAYKKAPVSWLQVKYDF